MSDNGDTLLEFPCEFSVKAFGPQTDVLPGTVRALVEAHTGPLEDAAVRQRPSSGGKFLAITGTFTATSKAQLDAIYQGLSAHPAVMMAL